MYKSFYKSVFILLLLAGLLCSTSFAANLPAGYPKQSEFQSIGTVDSISTGKKLIVINDQEYIVPENIIVVIPNKRNSRLRDVRLGKTAGVFFTEGNETSMPKVTEIWVLP